MAIIYIPSLSHRIPATRAGSGSAGGPSRCIQHATHATGNVEPTVPDPPSPPSPPASRSAAIVSRRAVISAPLLLSALVSFPFSFPPVASSAAGLRKLSQAEISQVLSILGDTVPQSKAPLMLRLVFHDGATYRVGDGTGGVNGSVQYELERPENFGLKRGTNVIKQLIAADQAAAAKSGRAAYLSFADWIVLAAAYAVKVTNGPDMFSSLRVGRADAAGADPEGRLPEERLSADEQLAVFGEMGLSATEMVALLGSHTIGQRGFGGPLEFDNVYYRSLLERPWEKEGDKMSSMIGLASDRVLPDSEVTKRVIERFAGDQGAFFQEFERAFLKLSELGSR